MSDFIEEALMVFEEFRNNGNDLKNSISSMELRYQGDKLLEVAWEFSILLRSNGFFQESIACVEQLINCTDDAEKHAQLYMALGQVMEMKEDFEAATLYYLQAKSLKPTDKTTAYFVHNNLGYCLNLLERHDEAEGCCQVAIKIDPARHNAYKNLGIALQGKGRYADAARNFIKASEVYPADARAYCLVSELLANHGEIADEIPDIHKQMKLARARWAMA